MYTAHLVVTLRNIGTPFPVVVNVGIYSEGAMTLTMGPSDCFYADLFKVRGASYQLAHDDLVKMIDKMSQYSWVKPWIDPSEDAHAAKYYWQILPKRK